MNNLMNIILMDLDNYFESYSTSYKIISTTKTFLSIELVTTRCTLDNLCNYDNVIEQLELSNTLYNISQRITIDFDNNIYTYIAKIKSYYRSQYEVINKIVENDFTQFISKVNYLSYNYPIFNKTKENVA